MRPRVSVVCVWTINVRPSLYPFTPLPLYQVLLTDTTMRDAHQSLLATRVRTIDLVKVSRWRGAS